MPSEFENQQAVNRAANAKALLENPLFKEAVGKLKATYTEQLMNTNASQAALREELWRLARLVDVFHDHFVTVVNNGAVARADLEKIAREGERKKRFGIV